VCGCWFGILLVLAVCGMTVLCSGFPEWMYLASQHAPCADVGQIQAVYQAYSRKKPSLQWLSPCRLLAAPPRQPAPAPMRHTSDAWSAHARLRWGSGVESRQLFHSCM